jgi:hypothetical protein
MKSTSLRIATTVTALLLATGAAHAASYRQTIASFKNASQSADFFNNSYAYAVFPTVGKGSFIVGGAHGDGRVYAHGVAVGTTAVTVAWPHKDGNGLNVELKAMPVSGKLVIRRHEPKARSNES